MMYKYVKEVFYTILWTHVKMLGQCYEQKHM